MCGAVVRREPGLTMTKPEKPPDDVYAFCGRHHVLVRRPIALHCKGH